MTRVSEAVLFFILNATWQVTLVALLASAADRMLRDAKARYRHVLWVLALAACVALPGSVFLHSAPALIPEAVTAHTRPDQQAEKRRVESAAPKVARAHPIPAGMRKSWFWIRMPVIGVTRHSAMAALLLYVVLLLFRIGKFWQAWIRTRAVVRSALPIDVSVQLQLNQALARCQRTLDLKHLRVLSSTVVAVPVAAGILRPLVILPAYLLAEDDLDLLTSAIGHEAAHIARHDYLMNLIYELASLPLWFHPAIALFLRRIRQTRELRCDEIVAERLLRPSVYAQSLVQLAAAALPWSRSAATMTVGIADADILEERIMSILNYPPVTSRRWKVLSAIATSLLVAPGFAAGTFAMHVAVRQPATSAAIVPPNVSGNASPRLSASGQRSSPTSAMPATTPVSQGQSKAPSAIPEVRETIVIVAKRVNGQGREGAASKTPGSHDDGVHIGTGKGLGVGHEPAGRVDGGASGGAAGGDRVRPSPGPQKAKHGPGVIEGNLIRLIEPIYPEEARAAGIEGDVVFEATIGKSGDLENLRPISGPPTLQAAALDAMKQWKYEPYRLNSEPVEVKASITFRFRLAE